MITECVWVTHVVLSVTMTLYYVSLGSHIVCHLSRWPTRYVIQNSSLHGIVLYIGLTVNVLYVYIKRTLWLLWDGVYFFSAITFHFQQEISEIISKLSYQP